MDLVIKQHIDRTETVSSSFIDTLYQLTKPDSSTGQSLANAVLVGRIQSAAAYEDAVNFLNTKFSSEQDNGSDLQITVLNNNYFIRFADPEVEEVIKAALGRDPDEGVLASELSTFRPNFNGNTLIEYFDEMKYCSPNVLDLAFSNCTNLKSIDLTNITAMSGNGFYFRGCINLEYFHGINGERGVLNLTNLTNASFTTWFGNCKKLERITSLGFISSIGDWAFSGCSKLESATGISSITAIKQYAFDGCTSLATITLQNITRIDACAFNACSSLEYCGGPNSNQGELYLPNLTGTLGSSAFKGCAKLTSITSLGSITSIRGGAFENCTSLATITFPGSIDSVAESAFNNTPWYNSQNNTAIYIDNVLYKCKGTIPSSLVIPNNVVSITDNAFRSITSLESLTIGSGVNSIGVGESIFYGCTNLETIVVDSNNAKYNSGNGGNAIIEAATNTLVAGCKGTSIPNSVTKIANRAFGNNKGIISINLNNVSEIGDYAFAGDSNLITVSQGNLTKLTEGAFNGCSSLQTIDISNVTTFGSGIFFNCSALNNVTLSSSLSTIPSSLFRGCLSLTSITIPNSVTSIGSYAFSDCKSLDSIIIPNSVTSIGSRAFDCSGIDTSKPDAICLSGGVTFGTGLTKIVGQTFYSCKFTSLDLPANITTLENYAIDNCRLLQSIIMRGVTSIGDRSFRGSALTTITIETSSVPTIHEKAFKNDNGQYINNGNFTIYVPSNLLSSYQTAPNWSTLYNDGKIQPISI